MEEKVLKRVYELIAKGEAILSNKVQMDGWGGETYLGIDEQAIPGLWSAGLSFIKSIYGETHPHFAQFEKFTHVVNEAALKACISILKSIKEEIEAGWLTSFKGLVSAEIFTDFLEMAEHLLNEDYKDPAAVMIGSVLEEHLRQLCTAKGVELEIPKHNGDLVPKKASALNVDLRKGNAYNLLDQQQVTTWLGLRNDAAHAHYDNYTKEQVVLMLQGVQNFIVRNPA
jgi:hypothetical protein